MIDKKIKHAVDYFSKDSKAFKKGVAHVFLPPVPATTPRLGDQVVSLDALERRIAWERDMIGLLAVPVETANPPKTPRIFGVAQATSLDLRLFGRDPRH